jgi:hypothetical protein
MKMSNLKNLNVQVGIYDTQATITRHRNGTVTIRAPYIKWVNNTGYLAFEKLIFCGDMADRAKRVFTDESDLSYGEFIFPTMNRL